MKLTRIRLHPFGGTPDQTCSLYDGINVIEGPNEFGKSTLNNALWHALFTPSNLTPAKLKSSMGRWFPKPNGDHVRVTLEFTADGQGWTLQKSWGAGASCSLQATGGTSVVDHNTVQKRLLDLLRRNQATWQHVLFVNQAELSNTIQLLQKNASQLDDVQPFVLGAAAIPGDIAAEKLDSAIERRIEQHFSRWDMKANGPENGRGITNPWMNKIGPQLAAYYAMETIRKELIAVVVYEQLVDGVNGEIRELDGAIEVERKFVETGRSLRNGVAKRGGLEEKAKRIEAEMEILREVLLAWPGADKAIQDKQEEQKRIEKEIDNLAKELANARARISAGQLKKGYEQLVKSRTNWENALDRLNKSKPIPAETLSELKKLNGAIERLRINIAAQKLNATMSSQRPTSVTVTRITVTRGTCDPETISVEAGQAWDEQAEGKIKFEIDDLQILVASGTSDVNTLFTDLQTAQSRQSEVLGELELKDFAAVEAANASHKEFAGEEKRLQGLYDSALQGRSVEDWASEVAAVDALPQTRSVEVLDEEVKNAVNRKARLRVEIENGEQQVKKWTEQFENLEKLTDKILDTTSEVKNVRKELSELPPLPNGFDSVSEYLEKLDEKEEIQKVSQDGLNKLKIQQAELLGAAPKQTAEELRDELEFKEREFQREDKTGQALLRIRSKLKGIVAEREEEDPMKNLEATISRYFNQLTFGRYASVRIDGNAPVEVEGKEVEGKLTLETGILSQGTAGSLALATRLALAELYLDEMDGFLVLDDPFTDMDPGRRRAAGECLAAFAEKRQVTFFTCHPNHAAEIDGVAGVTRSEISQ